MSDPRTVIITGGSRGLGAGIVQAFLDSGDRVATCSRTPTGQTNEWLSTHPDNFHFAAVDLADRESTTRFMAEVVALWGPPTVLVNNAGVAPDGVLPLMQDDAVDLAIDLNLRGSIHLSKLAARRMISAGGGHIVNVSSIVGLSGYRGLSVYSATKAALDGLTRALARELGGNRIFVNSVAPGYLRTEMSHGLDAGQLEQIVRRTPAGRLGEPEDVARAIQFLTSPDNTYITGHVLVIDGGLTA